jgi:hypothetical protein
VEQEPAPLETHALLPEEYGRADIEEDEAGCERPERSERDDQHQRQSDVEKPLHPEIGRPGDSGLERRSEPCLRKRVCLGTYFQSEQLRHEAEVHMVRRAGPADAVQHLLRYLVLLEPDDDAMGADPVDGEFLDDRFQLGGRAHDSDAVDGAPAGFRLIVQDGDDLLLAGRHCFDEFDVERGKAAHADHHDVFALELVARRSESTGGNANQPPRNDEAGAEHERVDDRGGARYSLEARKDEERRAGHQFGDDDRLGDLAGVMHGEVARDAVAKAKGGERHQGKYEGDEAVDQRGPHSVIGQDVGFPYRHGIIGSEGGPRHVE